jgi:hypothetical protein
MLNRLLALVIALVALIIHLICDLVAGSIPTRSEKRGGAGDVGGAGGVSGAGDVGGAGGVSGAGDVGGAGGIAEGDYPLTKYYSQIPARVAYDSRAACASVHNGQVKLFLTELEFMTECLPAHDSEAIFVYAGSAPSNKISYLAELFPRAKFVLVDPNEHYVKFGAVDQYDSAHIDEFLYFVAAASDNQTPGARMRRSVTPHGEINTPQGHIQRRGDKFGAIPADLAEIIKTTSHRYYVIEDYFTEDLAAALAPLCTGGVAASADATTPPTASPAAPPIAPPTYFISDIRTANSEVVEDIDILWNSAMMYNWLKILRPRRFMLKFRCPWPITSKSQSHLRESMRDYHTDTFAKCEIPFLDNYTRGEFHFIKPEKIYMQAYAPPHSAETRLVGAELAVTPFDISEYEEKMAWFNQVCRCESRGAVNHDRELSLSIFDDYIEKYSAAGTASEMFERLLAMIERTV